MARRPVPSEPISRLAVWSRRLALFALAAALLSILVVRSGVLEIQPAMATFAGALGIALLAIIMALASLVPIWSHGARGFGHALLALAIGATLLAYPTYLGVVAYRLPAIADITTDTADPPRFDTLARVRPRDANSPDYPGSETAKLQLASYSDLEPLVVQATPQVAYDAALSVIGRRRWRIVDERPPLAGRRDGHIEAVARTTIMGFREDIAVRIRAAPDGARVDIRSASRYGPLDFGSNASRIRQFVEAIDQSIAAKPRPAPAEAKAPVAPAAATKRNQADKR